MTDLSSANSPFLLPPASLCSSPDQSELQLQPARHLTPSYSKGSVPVWSPPVRTSSLFNVITTSVSLSGDFCEIREDGRGLNIILFSPGAKPPLRELSSAAMSRVPKTATASLTERKGRLVSTSTRGPSMGTEKARVVQMVELGILTIKLFLFFYSTASVADLDRAERWLGVEDTAAWLVQRQWIET